MRIPDENGYVEVFTCNSGVQRALKSKNFYIWDKEDSLEDDFILLVDESCIDEHDKVCDGADIIFPLGVEKTREAIKK